MKKTALFLVVVFLMIGACGCSMRGQDKIDRMISYINNKYTDDHFAFVEMSGGHMGSNVTKIVVESNKYPGKEIRVICSEVEGEEIYTDTYLNVKFEEQTYDYIRETLIKKYGDNIYLEYVPDDIACIEAGSSSTTFKEYISDPNVYIYFSAVVGDEVNDENAVFAEIKELFSDSVLRAHIYFVDTEEEIANNAQLFIKNKTYSKELYFVKNTVDEYKTVEWTDGV